MKSNRSRQIFSQVAGIVFSLLLAACGGGGSGSGGESSVSSGAANADSGVSQQIGAASVSWLPPTTRLDGSALTDLAGYRVYYGTRSGDYTNVIDVPTAGIVDYVIENLLAGTYYFAVTAYDQSGIESPLSSEVSSVIN